MLQPVQNIRSTSLEVRLQEDYLAIMAGTAQMHMYQK